MVCRTIYVLAVSVSAASLLLAPLAHAAGPPVHVVEAGDTLWRIAQDAGVDATALAQLNGVQDGDLLVVGQALKLPGAPSKPAPPARSTYTVADGDTLWSIAQQLDTTTAALVELNHLDDADRLALGSELVVPGGGSTSSRPAPASAVRAATSAAPTARSAATPSSKRILVPYTVQSGETLSQIARQFDVRGEAIAQASGLDDPNRIAVGAVLKVPLPGYEHVVKAGETLRDIAAQEKVDLGSLIDFNELDDPGLIRVGQVVLVPAPSPNQQAATVSPSGASEGASAPKPSAAPAAAPPASASGAMSKPGAATSAGPVVPAAPAAATPPKPAAPTAPTAPPPGEPGQGVAGVALKLLGAPYVFGGSSPSGFDCSGFVWYVVRQSGKSIGRGMLGEYNSGAHPGRDELKAGDLVFFQNTYTPGLSHNGIYIGNGQFVHAADEQSGVTVSSLSSGYWSSHWFGATRLP